jgi:hypothetical protein
VNHILKAKKQDFQSAKGKGIDHAGMFTEIACLRFFSQTYTYQFHSGRKEMSPNSLENQERNRMLEHRTDLGIHFRMQELHNIRHQNSNVVIVAILCSICHLLNLCSTLFNSTTYPESREIYLHTPVKVT